MVVHPRWCARVGHRQVYGPRSPQGDRGPLIYAFRQPAGAALPPAGEPCLLPPAAGPGSAIPAGAGQAEPWPHGGHPAVPTRRTGAPCLSPAPLARPESAGRRLSP